LAQVELSGVGKVYPRGIRAVRGVDLTVEDGTLFVIVGPSGSGKSTILRLIAGLESPTEGEIRIDGARTDGLSPRDRDLAMAFQTPVVYPHLSVFENLAFGLRARRTPWAEVGHRVEEVAALLGLMGLLGRRPATLSGGQRQRVALGRALVRRPKAFLLDEPFSSLDPPLRAAIRAELGELQRRLGTTMIHVTHDQAEALALGTRIAVVDAGRVVQQGPPLDVYDHPATRFVGEFVGSPPMSVLPCVVETSGATVEVRPVDDPGAAAWTSPTGAAWAEPLRRRGGGRVDLGIRAEHIHRAGTSPGSTGLAIRGRVRRLEPIGAETQVTLDVGPHALSLRLPARAPVVAGEAVDVSIDPSRVVWFDPEDGRALA
jgi:ABC-type sugar transport system ATPase subunit